MNRPELAHALASASYVLCVPRPAREGRVPLGGPSIALSPQAEVLVETTEAVVTVKLQRARVQEARRRYPGNLALRSDVYAAAWARVPASRGPHSKDRGLTF